MSEIRGIVKNLRTQQTDHGPKLTFSMALAEGRDVPVEASVMENLVVGEEIIAFGNYDNEGILFAQMIRRVPIVQPPPPPRPEKLRLIRMILVGILGDLLGFIPTIALVALLHMRASLNGKMSGSVLFLYTLCSIGCALLIGLKFSSHRRKENLLIAAIASLALPVVLLLK
jgi:hypothetical protein